MMKSFLQRNCQDVTALVLAGEDRSLGFFERWVVRAHLKACTACPRFSRQVALMRQALPRWRSYRDGAD
jgi:predicted anti-sigma-YlaC factor YlaD